MLYRTRTYDGPALRRCFPLSYADVPIENQHSFFLLHLRQSLGHIVHLMLLALVQNVLI